MSDAGLRQKLLSTQLRQAREGFALAATRLDDHAQLIALLEGELAALEGQIGSHRVGLSSRELAATVVFGEQARLRPHLPFISEDATKQARTALMAGAE